MRYQSVQFITKVVVTKTPYTPIGDAESLDVPTVDAVRAYLIEDDGPDHIRLTKAVGGISVRVPWSNVAGCVFAPKDIVPEITMPPEPEKTVVAVPPEPSKGFPELPRAAKGPRRGGILR